MSRRAVVHAQGNSLYAHQCRTLREVAPEGRRGPSLPVFPLPFAERLRLTLGAHTEGTAYASLRDHFARVSTAMNDA